MIKAILTGLVVFLFCLLIHITIFNLYIPYERTKWLLLSFALSIVIFPLIFYILPSENFFLKFSLFKFLKNEVIQSFLTGILVFLFLFLGYLEFYFTAERSITFRMLMIIEQQKEQRVNKEQMLLLYDKDIIITKRLEDLAYGGYLKKVDNNYKITPKGAFISKVYKVSITLLNLGSQKNE